MHEAANDPGGQVRLTAQTPRRAEMISLIDWRFAECNRLGVTFRFNSYADADTVLAEAPDAVVIATGGLPHTEVLAEGDGRSRQGQHQDQGSSHGPVSGGVFAA